jgi:integrase
MLSLTAILRLPPGRVYCGHGLVLIVPRRSTRRRKSPRWMFRYKSLRTGRYTETSIGSVYSFDHYEANNETMRMREWLAKGQDPVIAKREQRAAGTTFAEACEGWINKHRSKWRSTRHIEVLIGKHGQSLAETPIRMITSPMIVKALSPLWKHHPEQARRTLSTWAHVFDYAKTMGVRAGDNPAAWRGNMEHIFPNRPKNHNKHFSSLPFNEVPEFVHRLRLRQAKGQAASAFEWLILTASRSNETLGMRWTEVDPDFRVWTLPPERTKQNRKHCVPLSGRCLELLAVQNEYRKGDFVFPGRNGGPLGARALFMLLRDMGVFVTVHGFRASFRNWGARTRQDRDLLELSLGHLVADKTEGAYWTDEMLSERRSVMAQWASYCGSAAEAEGR